MQREYLSLFSFRQFYFFKIIASLLKLKIEMLCEVWSKVAHSIPHSSFPFFRWNTWIMSTAKRIRDYKLSTLLTKDSNVPPEPICQKDALFLSSKIWLYMCFPELNYSNILSKICTGGGENNGNNTWQQTLLLKHLNHNYKWDYGHIRLNANQSCVTCKRHLAIILYMSFQNNFI